METTATLGYIRKETLPQRMVRSKTFWVVMLGFLFSYPLYRSYYRVLPPELPIQFNLPSYELTNEFGKGFGSRDLDGKVYLVTFTKSTCDDFCMKNMGYLQKIQQRMKGVKKESSLVTISLDSKVDTPEVLHKFARSLDSNPFFWNFLTSKESNKVSKLLSDGFRIKAVDDTYMEKLFLVDRRNRVRGLYKLDKLTINKLMIDIGLLINRDELYK
ncbi:MAG: SCO family protein [Bacteriovoracaceae bacterium]|nr:SCO family protein [Bacteriovoracaceae bacterium]